MFARPVSAQDASAAFAAATTAFEQGDYRRALDLFESAEQAGMRSASLVYNVGVTQYRLEEYVAAAATFARLANDFPAMRPVALYNRGLALLADAQHDAARAAFVDVLRGAPGAELERLAQAALARLDAVEAASPERRAWRGFVELGLGYDDNVALVDELSLPAGSEASSPLLEALAYASRSWQTRAALRLDMSAYTVRYGDADEYDQDAVRVDGAIEAWQGAWRLTAGPHVGFSWLGGDTVESVVGAGVRARRALGDGWQVDVGFVYNDVDARAQRFEYLDGDRRQLRLSIEQRGGATGAARFGYVREENDRRSASVSSDRDRLMLGYRRSLGARWTLDAALGRRESRYRTLAPQRRETLTELSATLQRDIARDWLMTVGYRWLDNDSTALEFSYRSNRAVLGISRTL